MTKREKLLKLYRRQGTVEVPVGMHFCPALEEEFARRYPNEESYLDYFGAPYRIIYDPGFPWNFDAKWRVDGRDDIDWMKYYSKDEFQRDKKFDLWGTAHEEGSEFSKHMTQMHHPLKNAQTLQEIQDYPWPDFSTVDFSYLDDEVKAIQDKGLAVFVWAECTIWETAWYVRGMDNLMMDIALEDEKAIWLLDMITDKACQRVRAFAKAGVDILGLGDDVGMQDALMVSKDMYRQWFKPRLAKVIAAAKEVKPDILISYHSCGYVTPLIGEFIEAGVDILNPVQPECMDFTDIHAEFGDRLSFSGTIGTQTTMPFGSPEDVKSVTKRNLEIAGDKGGLLCCPTHLLEPEVPWENIIAYIEACRSFTK
jgi:uroporphyrinogen decarboxylase